MKRVIGFNLGKAKKDQVLAFLLAVITRAESDENVTAQCSITLQALNRAYNKYETLAQRHRINLLSEKVATLDTERDKAFTFLRNLIKALCDSLDKEVSEQARLLWKITKELGYAHSQQYDQQTGALATYCLDLLGNHREEVDNLQLTAAVENLQEANDAFAEVLAERTAVVAEVEKGASQEARRQAVIAYRNFVLDVNAAVARDEGAELQPFINWTNAEIDRLRVALKLSTSKPEKPSSGELAPGEGETEAKKYRWIRFKNGQTQVKRIRCEVGQPVPESKIPAAPKGKRWEGIPELMPDEDVTVNAVPLEEGEETDTNTPQDFTPEQLRAFPIYPSQYGAVTEITNPNSLISPFNPLSVNYKLSNLLPGTPAPTEGEVPAGKAKVKFDREAEEEEARAIKRFLHRELRKEKVDNLENLENVDVLENLEETDSALLDTKSFCLWYDLGSSVRTQGFVPECLTGFHWDIQQMDYVLDTAHHTIRLVKDEDENENEDQTLTPGMDWSLDVPAPEGWTKVIFRDKDGHETVKLYRNGSSVYTQGGYPENAPGYEWIGIHAILNGTTHTITEAEE